MKAIFLAAGEGSRLRPLTETRPKCMVEYKGRPLLHWSLESVRANGVEDIVIIKGYLPDKINVEGARCYVNADYASTNMVHTLFCAEDELAGDVLISYSDIIYTKEAIAPLLACDKDFAVLVDKNWRSLWERRMENPLEDAETLKLNPNGDIIEIGKKAESYDDIEGQYMGLIKISGSAISQVREFYHSLDSDGDYDGKNFRNMYMTSFIQRIADDLMPVRAVYSDGAWLEVDTLDDLKCDIAIN